MRRNQRFTTISYRNAIYQGLFDHVKDQRSGLGLLYLVNDHVLIGSQWENDEVNGPSFMYHGDGSYIYGYWRNNKPNGFNFVRLGTMMIMGYYQNGIVNGNMLVLYEKYNLAVLLSTHNHDGLTQYQLLQKGEVFSDEDFEKFVSHSQWSYFEQNWKTLIKFLSVNYASASNIKEYQMKLRLVNQNFYKFGFDNGLSFIFNAEYKMVSMGSHQRSKINWLGIRLNKQSFYEQGNFQHSETIFAYQSNEFRPHKQIDQLYHLQLLRSMQFVNNFIVDPSKLLLVYYNQLAQYKLFRSFQAGQITNRTLDFSLQSQESFKKSRQSNKYHSSPKKQSFNSQNRQKPTLLQIPKQSPYNSHSQSYQSKNTPHQDNTLQEKIRLEAYQKELEEEIQRKKLDSLKQTEKKQIINKAPVMIKSKKVTTTPKTQTVQNKRNRRSPIFSPEIRSPSTSPIKQSMSPFRSKMKKKLFSDKSRPNQNYVYEPIQQNQDQEVKQFKLTRPDQRYSSPYRDLSFSQSKGESSQNLHGNFVPLTVEMTKTKRNKIRDNSVYQNLAAQVPKRTKRVSIDETPQFIPIDGQLENRQKNRNNVYLQNISNDRKRERQYDDKFNRSKPKTYLNQYQKQRTHSGKKNDKNQEYSKTIQAFNENNRVYEILSSPKNEDRYHYSKDFVNHYKPNQSALYSGSKQYSPYKKEKKYQYVFN